MNYFHNIFDLAGSKLHFDILIFLLQGKMYLEAKINFIDIVYGKTSTKASTS